MKRSLLTLVLGLALLPLEAQAAEHDHAAAEHDHAAVTAADTAGHEHAAMGEGPSLDVAVHEHGGMANWLLLVDRLEHQYQRGADDWQWEAQGWFGGDIDKLWLKTEGSWSERRNAVESSEAQVLYSHAVAPFWDVQTGLRHSDDGAARNWAVLGVKGLAPYWFDVDAMLYAGENGQWQAGVEVDYVLRLTQRWILQPRLQWRQSFSDDKAAGLQRGSFDSSVGLRLRYEIVREVAPYIGIEQDIGGQRHADETRVVAGIRLWY